MPKCPKDCHKPNPLIFRRVIIPAALGDDTGEFKPEITNRYRIMATDLMGS